MFHGPLLTATDEKYQPTQSCHSQPPSTAPPILQNAHKPPPSSPKSQTAQP
ncbi:uncharacterized protein LACBIDRAFT_311359 [Laccaria bicolor S238N-H82]|uniref:Predicted protein n=1 Tax=Laccaria bicolor (strain S238N-H82 / ATCC MYA-4686) TaxID=486041 RepID=B0CZU3_LACBS|nr:uncharacterized protein LACBIDRAFT_311359 [Laccaria bicolor S238N-H82]EDR12212.1 predicted protein [Laccaria bicolor S238N-H82]|eukprot:XP_001876476.1 predicted protein [Laccaria bicolor S238N-H82]